jgi:hypothetical protein
MIRIAITQAAFEAIAATFPLGNVGYENKTDEEGNRLIRLDRAVVDRLRAMRGVPPAPRIGGNGRRRRAGIRGRSERALTPRG